jgi:hypothetical protein
MVIIYNILEKLNCTSYILTSIKFIIQLKFYIILIIYINFLAFYRKKIQTCLRPPRTYWSSSATALLIDQPSHPNILLECPYSFHGGDGN